MKLVLRLLLACSLLTTLVGVCYAQMEPKMSSETMGMMRKHPMMPMHATPLKHHMKKMMKKKKMMKNHMM